MNGNAAAAADEITTTTVCVEWNWKAKMRRDERTSMVLAS